MYRRQVTGPDIVRRCDPLTLLGALLAIGAGCGSGAADNGQAADGSPPTSGGPSQAQAGQAAAGGFTSVMAAGAGGAAGSAVGAGAGAGGKGPSGFAGGGAGPVPTKHCKRGIGAPGPSLNNSQVLPGIAWWYNWTWSRQSAAAGLEFAPMVWGGPQLSGLAAKLPADAHYLLGFNEPNFFAQANLSATAAAQLWPQVEAVAKARGLELVSPAVNYCGDDAAKTGPCNDTNPVHYLENFFAACNGCRVDYVAVHWYNCSVTELQFYLGLFRRFNKPIWLTEFACAYGGDTSAAGQEGYMRAAVPLLEADAHVFRYAWFSGGGELAGARLLEDGGALTPLGKVYAALPSNAECSK